jgi:glutamate-1-semialdehyde 2,1-aminomutase
MVHIQHGRSARQKELVDRAKAILPGGTTNSLVQPAGREIVIERGEGPYIYDVDGRQYLDFLVGGGALILGHAHPRIVETINSAVLKGTHHFVLHQRTIELAERISQYVPSAEMMRFAGTGTEATFHALRLARAVTGRQDFIKFDGAYHGHHDLVTWSWEGSESELPAGDPESAGIQEGVENDIYVLPFNDAAAVTDVLMKYPDRFAAVICEPYQRAISPVPGFLEALRTACDRTGTMLIFDEVVTAFRIAPGTAQARFGVVPDITVLGKAIAAGMPMAVLAGKRKILEHLDPSSPREVSSFHCGTMNANLLAVECAHTALDILMDESGLDQLGELADMTRTKLARIFHDARVPVYMSWDAGGLFHAFFTDRPVRNALDVRQSNLAFNNAFHLQLLEAGIFKLFAKGYVSLAHNESHIDALAEASKWAVDRVKQT